MKGRNRLYLFFVVLGVVGACNSDRIFEEYQGMPALNWEVEDTVSFEVEAVDPNTAVSSIGIRYNDTYGFHNLYVRYLLTDSSGNYLADSLININLFDPKTGRPLGDGFGNVYTKYDTLPLIHTLVGERVTAQFIQYMRKEQLEGIEAVGLKINRK